MEETAGRVRARRNSLFSQTVIWATGLICTAFLLGALAQAWSNSQLMQQVQAAQNSLVQVRMHHTDLLKQSQYYNDPTVLENEARQQLGYIRPGEHAVVVISATAQNKQYTSGHTQPTQQQGFWQQWWNSLFGAQ
jgi:cell division protein FtsB